MNKQYKVQGQSGNVYDSYFSKESKIHKLLPIGEKIIFFSNFTVITAPSHYKSIFTQDELNELLGE